MVQVFINEYFLISYQFALFLLLPRDKPKEKQTTNLQ